MINWKRSCRRKGKNYILVFLAVYFFLAIWTKDPIFLFGLDHASYIAIPGEQWKHWMGQSLGLRVSEPGHSPAVCRHLSKCALSHQTPYSNSSSRVSSHSEWKPKFSLWLYTSDTFPAHLSDCIPHLSPALTAPARMAYLHSPTCQAFSCPRAFAHIITSPRMFFPSAIWSIPHIQTSYHMSLCQRSLPWPPHINK